MNRRAFFQGGAALAACAPLQPLQTLLRPARVDPLPLPLSYKGMFNDIIDICPSYHGTTREAALSPSRERREVRARQSAMYIARRVTGRSLPEIGRRIGCRDHTTVLHADRKISGLAERDPIVRHSIETLIDACLRMARTRIAAGAASGRYLG